MNAWPYVMQEFDFMALTIFGIPTEEVIQDGRFKALMRTMLRERGEDWKEWNSLDTLKENTPHDHPPLRHQHFHVPGDGHDHKNGKGVA